MEKSPVKPFKGPRIVTSGIVADNSGLLKILDDCGITVASDEVTHESLRFRTDVPVTGDPFVGMARQIGEIEGCSVLFDPGKVRGTMLIDLVKQSKADGVLFVQTKFCDPEEYDYVPIKRMLDKAGIRSLQVEIDQQTSNSEQARTAVETFCEIIQN
jgi:benzoyl-CoA reductase/2-hydroxyglutaryl-CoA dehydratase subunit BcrC/BadD/HgdB